jgi:ComF family protein
VPSLQAVANAILSALIAPPCAACGRVLDAPLRGAACERCWEAIARLDTAFTLSHISHARAIGAYEGSLRDIVHARKYDGRRSLAPRLARLLAECGADVLADADAVVPVPLHRQRLRERGFNQAADLAHGLNRPVWPVVARVRRTRPQVDLAAAERILNVRGAFALRSPAARRQLAGRTVVLVDDVTTTGATPEACAATLAAAGARDVRALTAARALSGRP